MYIYLLTNELEYMFYFNVLNLSVVFMENLRLWGIKFVACTLNAQRNRPEVERQPG